jgi:DNA-binding NarL/FixJ family response regulator
MQDEELIGQINARPKNLHLGEAYLQVLYYMAAGTTVVQMAKQMCTSYETVKGIVQVVKERLGASTSAEAVAIAFKHRIII